jgi:DMSO/TMAO reductase YedYZ molybdopterin-dependent catalytic subunit
MTLPIDEHELQQRVRRLSRRGFLAAAGAAVLGGAGYAWLTTCEKEDGLPWPLRRMLEVNGLIAGNFSATAQQYDRALVRMPRVNGVIGLTDNLGPANWRVNVTGMTDPSMPISLTIEDIRALPRVDMVTRMCCIEGWSEIVHWAGSRLVDLTHKYPALLTGPDGRSARYLGADTPDEAYYVGLDIKSALHPQTLLCYEMNGKPLTADHGAPLRLVLPHKYGIKSLKCVGSLTFAGDRPDDYWAQRGYDYYAGL